MANQSVLELAVGTGKWDAGLKKAKSALDNFTQANGGLQQALDKESQKMQRFVQMMGGMESTAKTAKGQMNDYKSTIEQLTMQYNRMTEAQKKVIGQDYLQAIDQMKQKYQSVNEEIQEMNRSLNNVKLPDMNAGGGGLFSGMGDKMSGALQVFAGNMLTKAAGAVAELGSEIFASVQQGIELAKQGEGIRVAFERLGRGDILNGLREATHGTVTDLELMKAAVKFNDFKLPLDELGTMLAFAQQKAKDTGQSVDYMVDSIVTGLGRKSLMILDNLGLSATEVKEKMKETGDMTKAVGEIIREQMSKAGDYVETAADRATQADVKLKNAMEDLGRTFEPLTSASGSLWNSIKVGALNALNTAVKPLIQALAEAGMLGQGARSSAGFNNLGGNSKVDRMIGRLGNGKSAGAYSIYQQQLGEFDKYINNKRFHIAAYGNDNSSVAQFAKARLQTELDGALKMRAEYVKRAQELHNQVPSPFEPASTNAGGGGRGGKGGSVTDPSANIQSAFEKAMGKAIISADSLKGADSAFEHMSVWVQMTDDFKRNMLGVGDTVDELEKSLIKLGEITDKDDITSKLQQMNKALSEQQTRYNLAGQAAQNFGAALAGVEDPAAKAAGTVMQAVASIALGFAMASSNANTAGTGWGWLAWLAAGTAAMATTIATVHSLTGYAQGGMIKGNSYSGDNIGGLVDGSGLVGLNAGELVLNAAQQNNVAQNLEGAGARTVRVVGKIRGTDIILSADRTLMEQGKQLAVWGRG